MLTYDLERRGQLARYDYLYRCIKGDIFSGTLAAGEKLPSKRALARHLQVSVATVESAYNQLAAEGRSPSSVPAPTPPFTPYCARRRTSLPHTSAVDLCIFASSGLMAVSSCFDSQKSLTKRPQRLPNYH